MAIAGKNTGHMGTVPVGIICAGLAHHKAFTVDNARPSVVGVLQIVMMVYTAIDHGDANARSVQAVLLQGKVVHHRWNIVIPCSLRAAVRSYIGDIRMCFEPSQQSSRNAIGRSLDVLKRELHPAAARSHHLEVARLERLVELDDYIYGAIWIYWKTGEVWRNFVTSTGRQRCG